MMRNKLDKMRCFLMRISCFSIAVCTGNGIDVFAG